MRAWEVVQCARIAMVSWLERKGKVGGAAARDGPGGRKLDEGLEVLALLGDAAGGRVRY